MTKCDIPVYIYINSVKDQLFRGDENRTHADYFKINNETKEYLQVLLLAFQ